MQLENTILTMYQNRVTVFDTIYKKVIGKYYLRGDVRGLVLTSDM